MTAAADIFAKHDGFTLIEIIATIIIAAVLAALMVQFMGTAMTQSADPVVAVRTEAGTGAILEGIVSDYVRLMNANPATALATLAATDYGASVTMTYAAFDAAGQEVNPAPASSDTLKVTVQGQGYAVTTLLTNSRTRSDDPITRY